MGKGSIVAIRHASTIVLAFSYFLGSLGGTMTGVAVAVYLAQSGSGAAAVSGLLLASAFANILIVPFLAPSFDRFNPKHVAVFASIVDVFSLCLIIAIPSLPVLIFSTLLSATCAGMIGPALYHIFASTYAGVDEGKEAKAYSHLDTARLLGGISGPALGGYLVQASGLRSAVSFEVATVILMGISLLLFAPNVRQADAGEVAGMGFISKVAQAPALLLRNRESRNAIQTIWAAIIFTSIFNVALVFFAVDTLHLGGVAYAFFVQSFMIGRLLGAKSASFLSYGRASIALAASGVLMGASLLLVGLLKSFYIAIALLFLAGICNAVQVASLRLVVSHSVPVDVRPKAFSSMGSLNSLAMLIGYFIGAPIMEWVGPANSFVISGLGTVVLTSIFALLGKRFSFVRMGKKE